MGRGRGEKIPDFPVQELVKEYADGASHTQLAEHFGVSATTIRNRLRKAGVTLRYQYAPAKCGTRWNYKRGCRCDSCTKANTEYARLLRETLWSRYDYGNRNPDVSVRVGGGLVNPLPDHSPSCSCAACKAAKVKLQSLEDLGISESADHGTFDSYWLGCDCEACMGAYREKLNE